MKVVGLIRSIVGGLALLLAEFLIFPFQVIAVFIVYHHMVRVSARLNTSMTAVKILEGRLLMHWFGLRNDPYTADMATYLPNYAVFSLRVALLPLLVFYYVAGWSLIRLPASGDETFKDMVYCRTLFYDKLIQEWCERLKQHGQKGQLVLLGAGYDTRAVQRERFDFEGKRFEVDHERVQTIKRSAYQQSSVCRQRAAAEVVFVTVDFKQDRDWMNKLIQAGFDGQTPTLFLWEGVTLYLPEEAVLQTIQEITDLCQQAPTASCVLVTGLYSTSFVDGSYSPRLKNAQAMLEKTGEPFLWGLPFGAGEWKTVLQSFVKDRCGVELGTYRALGSKHEKGPYLCCTEMLIPSGAATELVT